MGSSAGEKSSANVNPLAPAYNGASLATSGPLLLPPTTMAATMLAEAPAPTGAGREPGICRAAPCYFSQPTQIPLRRLPRMRDIASFAH